MIASRLSPVRYALAAWLLTLGTLCYGQDNGDAMDYVPDNALALLRLQPQSLLNSPTFQAYPLEVAQAAGLDYAGFDPLTIQTITVASGMPGPAGPQFGAVVELSQAVELDELKGKLIDTEPAPGPRGTQLFPITETQGELILTQVSPTRYLVGTEAYVRLMLTGNGGSPSKTLLQSIANAEDAHALVFDFLTLRGLALATLQQVQPQIPPMIYGDVYQLAENTDQIAVQLRTGDEPALNLAFVAGAAAGAEKIEEALNNLKATGIEMLFQQAQSDMEEAMANATPRVRQATLDYLQRIRGLLEEQVQPLRSGNNVIIKIDQTGSISLTSMASTGVMAGLLLPAVQSARQAAQRVQTANQLKQIMLAMLNHESSTRKLPTDIVDPATGEKLLSWRVAILPYLDEQALYEQFHLDEPWDSPHNLPLVEQMPEAFRNVQHPSEPGTTSYQKVAGPEGMGLAEVEGLAQITDGMSNTIAVLETPDFLAVPWSQPADLELDAEDLLIGWRSVGYEGFHVAMVDGAVRYLSANVDPETFAALLTPGGQETIIAP